MSQAMSVGELVFNERIQLMPEVNFGIDMASALSGKEAIPPEGVRVDVPFSGELTGPRIAGKIQGTDYALMRGDGITRIDVRAVITTDGGDRIALSADGVARVEPGTTIVQLRENVRLHSTTEQYRWVNRLQVWAGGEVDLSNGQATLKAYEA